VGKTFVPNSTAVSSNAWSAFAFLGTVSGINNAAPGVSGFIRISNPSAAMVHNLIGQLSGGVSGGQGAGNRRRYVEFHRCYRRFSVFVFVRRYHKRRGQGLRHSIGILT
jgi:hypothetical protein